MAMPAECMFKKTFSDGIGGDGLDVLRMEAELSCYGRPPIRPPYQRQQLIQVIDVTVFVGVDEEQIDRPSQFRHCFMSIAFNLCDQVIDAGPFEVFSRLFDALAIDFKGGEFPPVVCSARANQMPEYPFAVPSSTTCLASIDSVSRRRSLASSAGTVKRDL